VLAQGGTHVHVVQGIESSLEYRTTVLQALYLKLLRRQADLSGLNVFINFLSNGGTAGQAEAIIIGSPEYYQLHSSTNTGFLTGLYQDVLNRSSVDSSGAQAWGQALSGGASPQAVATAILGSFESDQDEVQGLYNQLLHRPAETSGLNAFTNALQQGMTNELVIALFTSSPEYYTRAQG
jgi:hypothetical protein